MEDKELKKLLKRIDSTKELMDKTEKSVIDILNRDRKEDLKEVQ